VNPGAKRLVLVADDDAGIRQLIVRQLRPLDCDVLEARDGEEAVRLALAHEPDLLIVDIEMPGLSGYDVTREVRSRLPPHVRVLLISGGGASEEVSEALEVGADGYLRKPFGGAELREAVREFLRRAENGGAQN
jgi:two-component system, OmpR family, KDP operon response regulator KdpE